MLQMPVMTPVSGETWSVKESIMSEADMPEWGSREERGIHMEAVTAAACLASGVGTAFIFLLIWVMAADAIDYNRVTFGLNDEATSYAFYSFMRKLGQTVATILINVPLLRIGYEGSKLKTEGLTDAALQRMYNSSVMIPAVLFLLVFLILRFAYPLNKQAVEELQVKKAEQS